MSVWYHLEVDTIWLNVPQCNLHNSFSKSQHLCVGFAELFFKYADHERSRESIEAAYDKIIMGSFRERKRSKINLKSNLKKKVAESPPWIRNLANMVEVPSSTVISQRAILFGLLGVWSVMNPAEGGPAFQVTSPPITVLLSVTQVWEWVPVDICMVVGSLSVEFSMYLMFMYPTICRWQSHWQHAYIFYMTAWRVSVGLWFLGAFSSTECSVFLFACVHLMLLCILAESSQT